MNADAAAVSGVPTDRNDITRRLHQALWAMEHDDADGWREHVDALIEWRTQPFVQGLTRLARELESALGEGTGGSGASLPDACSRLEHVVTLTENASMHTLDLIQECGQLLSTLPAGDDASAGVVAGIRSRLSEMTAAQGYQDLTGQIILRVVELVRAVHAGLGDVTDGAAPLQLSNRGNGPSVAGLDEAPATQDDANQLLSSLGI
ncbi:protein phosphatase CheZ [Lysobacter sp. A3-1-A15]|uniref:protein phosphatase CheZ n=1 Tax=Novilysobacter viscosus TaxID=3098602 RepID=UPI002EDA87DB